MCLLPNHPLISIHPSIHPTNQLYARDYTSQLVTGRHKGIPHTPHTQKKTQNKDSCLSNYMETPLVIRSG